MYDLHWICDILSPSGTLWQFPAHSNRFSIILAYSWDIPFPCLLVVLILSYLIDYWAKIINNAMVIPRSDSVTMNEEKTSKWMMWSAHTRGSGECRQWSHPLQFCLWSSSSLQWWQIASCFRGFNMRVSVPLCSAEENQWNTVEKHQVNPSNVGWQRVTTSNGQLLSLTRDHALSVVIMHDQIKWLHVPSRPVTYDHAGSWVIMRDNKWSLTVTHNHLWSLIIMNDHEWWDMKNEMKSNFVQKTPS